MYAVYGRAVGRAEWGLRDVFATQDEAEHCAARLVTPVARDTRESGEEAWAEAVVVESPSHGEAPEHLPAEWIVPVVARFAHRERPEHRLPEATAESQEPRRGATRRHPGGSG
jgi:hypothetical protein